MTTDDAIRIIPYEERYAWPTVRMWRASMERALGVKDPHSWEEQVGYLRHLASANEIYLAFDEPKDAVVGFLVVGGSELEQLYIHVDYQGMGIGTQLLNLAKERSPGKLQLYTFAVNKNAQRFYEGHGFYIIGRGVERESGMADIRYQWLAERPGPDFIVLAGAPGAGKSTISEILHEKFGSCLIDFGSLRQFHLNRTWSNANPLEEQMAFDNLVAILKNYARHGYHHVIVNDLRDHRVQQIPEVLADYNVVIITLVISDDEVLRARVLNPQRDSGFRDADAALAWNRALLARPPVAHEYKLDTTALSVAQTVDAVLELLQQAESPESF
ncbi:MAG: GNAT family N-acetyltransferase [Caldilineaceae bacterium]|nr:GNAT family N-acetyltransferase [Caldilineaceae bacterium]